MLVERRLSAILAADVAGYTRLMGLDEAGTLVRLKAHRKELIDPRIAEYGGRIVKVMGDGLLLEFSSVIAAVECAIAMQRGMTARNAAVPDDQAIRFRVGIHLGDVIIDEDDIYGDGVNLATRVQEIAEPDGICVSADVFRQVEGRLEASFANLGEKSLKNVARPLGIYALRAEGDGAEEAISPDPAAPPPTQEIRYCSAPDGTTLAFAITGAGNPVVKAATWMSHLEYDWKSPIWRHLWHALSARYKLVRYDERGNGLSDARPKEMSFESWVMDLETVIDAAAVDRFALLGISQGAAVSIAYAVRHPERVSHLVLHGGLAEGWRKFDQPDLTARQEALMTLMQSGWGQKTSAFRQLFTSLFLPTASAEQAAAFNELERVSTSPKNAGRIYNTFGDIDVADLLPKVTVPTLVLHSADDALVAVQSGRKIASMIPNARFVELDSQNHLIVENDPVWPRFRTEILDFLES